jgi:hypothetical protein
MVRITSCSSLFDGFRISRTSVHFAIYGKISCLAIYLSWGRGFSEIDFSNPNLSGP